MSPTVLNRISILLAFAGVFVAGVLSLGHLLNVSIPCGPHGGCDVVSNHPTSIFLGQPVAYYGLVGYAILAALAIARAIVGVGNAKPLIGVGYAISLIGTLISLYLSYVALAHIRATCEWCLVSAGIMTLLLVVHALMSQFSAMESEQAEVQEAVPGRLADTIVIAVAFLATSVGLAVMGNDLVARGKPEPLPVERMKEVESKGGLLPPGVHSMGDPKAKVTLLEFADLLCGACRRSFPEAKRLVEDSGGRIRFAFRHFPLYQNPQHRLALPAALLAEYAGEHGKFWEFVTAVYAAEPSTLETIEGFYQILRGLNVDVEPAKRRIADKDDPLFDRVYKDISTADALGIQLTPTYIVIAEGLEPQAVSGPELTKLLNEPQYKRLYEGN